MVKEAKDFLKAQVKKGNLSVDVFTDEHSVFNRIKHLLRNNTGYVGYFTRAHYRDPENVTFERLEHFFNNLQILKKYKSAIDISKFAKTPFDELEEMVQFESDMKQGKLLPGIQVHRDPRFVELNKKLKPYDWFVLVCVSEPSSKKHPQPDIEVVRVWGCPKWCIKRKNYFYNTYVKDEQHLQYVLIKKEFFKKVEKSAFGGKGFEPMLSGINYDGNWDRADSYPHHSENTANMRFGVTTKPSENLSFFNQRDNLTAFNDTNSSVSGIERLSAVTDGFPLRMLDIEVRKVLGLQRSEFDVSVPTFGEIINHIDLSENEREAEVIANACGKFVQIMDKIYSKEEEYNKISGEISNYFEKHKNLLDLMLYALLYAKDISPELIRHAREMYTEDEKAKKVNMVVTISLIQIFLDNTRKGIAVNPELSNIIHEGVIKGFVMYHLTKSWIRDRPKSTIDLKRAMIIVFKTGNLYQEIEGPGSQVTRSKLFKLIANYLYLHDNEYGQKVLEEQGWDAEIQFINNVMDKKKNNSKANTPFLSETARNIIKILPEVMSDKVDDRRVTPSYSEVFDELKMYNDDSIDYSYINHVEALFTSLSYYIKDIEPGIIKEFKG